MQTPSPTITIIRLISAHQSSELLSSQIMKKITATEIDKLRKGESPRPTSCPTYFVHHVESFLANFGRT
jgi:hypothetical protein